MIEWSPSLHLYHSTDNYVICLAPIFSCFGTVATDRIFERICPYPVPYIHIFLISLSMNAIYIQYITSGMTSE